MNENEIAQYIEGLPDEVLSRISFTSPWQFDSESSTNRPDPDGPSIGISSSKDPASYDRKTIQQECWNKFQENPQINTAVRDLMGRLTGDNFGFVSDEITIQSAMDEIVYDHRNRLYDHFPKYLGRKRVEGELHICLSCHENGFIEADFIDPAAIESGGDQDTGIIYHPDKTIMPLFYNIKKDLNYNYSSKKKQEQVYDQIPSVFIARYPELIDIARDHVSYSPAYQANSKNRKFIWKQFGGFYRFIVNWDLGLFTRRTTSYLRTTIAWLNQYENLKKYEIDHKKSTAAYAWVFSFEDVRSFKQWLSLSDSDKKKTAIMAKITPGSRLVLPPGMKVEAKNPQLQKISDSDTDILEMVSSGLNVTMDSLMGKITAPYSGSKASFQPMTDRISDERAYFERFLKYDFWSSIFFLKNKITSHRMSTAEDTFPGTFPVEEVVGWDKDGEEIVKVIDKKPEFLIDVTWPQSAYVDAESNAKAVLGVKHGNMSANMGIPNSELAKKLGFTGYGRLRLRKASEDRKYPKLLIESDQETNQEIVEGEMDKGGNKQPKQPVKPTKPVKPPIKKDEKDGK